MRTIITIPTSASAGNVTILHDNCIPSCNHCPLNATRFFIYQSQGTLPQARCAPSPFPSPFPFLPNAFPMVIKSIKKTCFLMPLIPLCEVGSRLFHLKAYLNSLLFAQFIAPHGFSCQDYDRSSIPHVLSSSRIFPMFFFAFRSRLFPFRYEGEGVRNAWLPALSRRFALSIESCEHHVEIRFHSHAA